MTSPYSTKQLVSSLPYYITGSNGDVVNAINDLINVVRVMAEEQRSAEQMIREAWEEVDIASYVDEALQGSSLSAAVTDLAMDYGRLRVDFAKVMEAQRGPQGPKGDTGVGMPGQPGPSGVESDEFKAFIERMKDMEDRVAELAQAVDELEDK